MGTLVYPPGLSGLSCFMSRLVGSHLGSLDLDILHSLTIRALVDTLGHGPISRDNAITYSPDMSAHA